MNIKDDLAIYSKAMDLRVKRQDVIASNIANADTPGFKARDIDFKSEMAKAISGISKPAELMYRTETQSAVDGNTVDMDVERASMAENALQYQILTQMVSDRFRNVRLALQ